MPGNEKQAISCKHGAELPDCKTGSWTSAFDEAVQKRGMSLPMFGKCGTTNAADIFWSET